MTDPNYKYVTSIQLMDEVIANRNRPRKVLKSWDNLFNFMFEHFPRPDSYKGWDEVCKADSIKNFQHEIALAQKIVKNTSRDNIDALVRAIPPEVAFAELVFPLAVCRALLLYHHINIEDPQKKLKSYREFYCRYGIMIVEAICSVDQDLKTA